MALRLKATRKVWPDTQKKKRKEKKNASSSLNYIFISSASVVVASVTMTSDRCFTGNVFPAQTSVLAKATPLPSLSSPWCGLRVKVENPTSILNKSNLIRSNTVLQFDNFLMDPNTTGHDRVTFLPGCTSY